MSLVAKATGKTNKTGISQKTCQRRFYQVAFGKRSDRGMAFLCIVIPLSIPVAAQN
jgi:hypothetical protein